MKQGEQGEWIVKYLADTWLNLFEYLLTHPEAFAKLQMNSWQPYLNFYQGLMNDTKLSEIKQVIDNRFIHADWQNHLLFNFIQRSYQLLAEQMETFVHELEIKDQQIVKKLEFFTKQYVDFLSPSNFAHTNPEVIAKTIQTNGQNLLDGFKQFQADLERGQGILHIEAADFTQFKLGENIAATPGKVIYQNDLIQLIQYAPVAAATYEHPLLIIPPWINKYYILDLQKENSFVQYLIGKGITVFMISWVNPGSSLRHKEFADYLKEGPLAALTVIKKILGHGNINTLGYCIGGTLLGCTLAYLAKQETQFNILSAAFLTTLFDFSDPGKLGVFIDEEQLQFLENHMEEKGYFDGRLMASIFNLLRANELIWSAFVNNYLIGKKPKPFAFLYWNADSTHIPFLVHKFYLRKMYLSNEMIVADKLVLNEVGIDLKKITNPCYFLATKEDHIAPWKSCYLSYTILNQQSQFVLANSGHVAGVVNPPDKNKYGYWTNKTNFSGPEDFLMHATYHPGSWWENYHSWLKKYLGKKTQMNVYELSPALQDAPGSYVKVRVNEID